MQRTSKRQQAAALDQPEGRRAKRFRVTRARLLMAAYDVMSRDGVDDARIKDITDKADVGFGTFYRYFDSKDALANSVLDCIINDIGRRNAEATASLVASQPALKPALRIRLVLRAAMNDPIWAWWAQRPDLLFDRMSKGFGIFALRDLAEAVRNRRSTLRPNEIETAWNLAVWLMVGGIHDVVVGKSSTAIDIFLTEAVLRVLGTESDVARRVARAPMPPIPPAHIDWHFSLAGDD